MPAKQLYSYILLSFPLAFIGLPIYIYLPNFYDQNFAISLQEIATILFFSRFGDAALDPLVGVLSDKYQQFRKKIIIICCPLLGLSVFCLFSPILSILSLKLSLIIFLFLTYSLFSIIWINHQALAVSFTNNYNLKTKIIAYRESIFMFGVIFASIFPFILEKFFDSVKSFEILGIFYFFLIIFCAFFFVKYVKIQDKTTKNDKFELKSFKNLIYIKKLRKFFVIFFFNSVASSIPASLITFFVAKVLNLESYIGIFLIIYFVGLIFGIGFWSYLSKKINNKTRAWLYSSIVTSLIFPFCFMLGENDFLLYSLICFLSGFAFGGDFSLSYSVLTDIIQEKKIRNNETTIFAATNFTIKISFTILSALLIFSLGTIRDLGDLNLEKSFLSYSYGLIPCFFKVLTSLLLFNFSRNYENY